MTGSYMTTTIAMNPVRATAGFKPDKGYYYLPRSKLVVPEVLQKQIFPFLEESIDQWSKCSEGKCGSGTFNNFLGESLFALLKWLRFKKFIINRVVVLQDAALLIKNEVYNKSDIFKQAPFNTEEFKKLLN